MKRYNFKQIKEAGDCVQYIKTVLGLPVSDSRCAAVWRSGKNITSVVLAKDEWSDQGNGGAGGSIIDLCAVSRFGGQGAVAMQQAQEFLGGWLNLTPMQSAADKKKKKPRYDSFIEKGYIETNRYFYTDLQGNTIHHVARLEKAGCEKEFLQGTPKHWGVKDVDLVLYNLPVISGSEWVVIVEGEKDADTLIALGVPATTVCGGAKKWKPEYAKVLAGKQIIIFPDNDTVGQDHAKIIALDIIDSVKGVKIVTASKLPKGDVTDFFTKENGNWDTLAAIVKNVPEATKADLQDAGDLFAIKEAKAANKSDFRNYIPVKREQMGKRPAKIEKEPKQLNDLIDEAHRRFLGFPRRVGNNLFDHDRDSGDICYLYKQDSLFAWVARKSKKRTDWSRNEGCVTRGEFYEGLHAAATCYEAISHVPDWPERSDVYYAYPEMPMPDSNHKYFETFVDFFAPANDLYKILLKTFISAPLYYVYGIARPLWIIDSRDGAGTGKTTMVELVSQLYGRAPISTDKQEMSQNPTELNKRLISSEGRQARMVLVDNVTGAFSCRNLADLATKQDISGRPAFGRGEETRPNNLTYVITANSANIDNDLASRAYYIIFRRPEYKATWKTDVMDYMKKYRFHILSDILDILNNHKSLDLPACTRCPEFETKILQAHCHNSDDYSNIIKLLTEVKAETNIEDELGKQIEETLRHNMLEMNIQYPFNPDEQKIFIHSSAITKWLEKEGIAEGVGAIQLVRNLANIGLLSCIAKTPRKFPHRGKNRRAGVMWSPVVIKDETAAIRIIGKVGHGNKFGEIVTT